MKPKYYMWIVYAITASVLWGLNYVLAERIFLNKISPITILGIEMFVGSIVLLTTGYYKQLSDDIAVITSDANLTWLVIAAVITMIAGNILIAFSVQEKNATLAGLIEISYPFFIAVFSYCLFGRTN